VMRQHGLNWSCLILPQLGFETQFNPIQEASGGRELSDPRWWVGGGASRVDHALTVFEHFLCPSDTLPENNPIRINGHAKSNYVGVCGNQLTQDLEQIRNLNTIGLPEQAIGTHVQRFAIEFPGILYVNSRTTTSDISDGASNTFILGERDGAELTDDETGFHTQQFGRYPPNTLVPFCQPTSWRSKLCYSGWFNTIYIGLRCRYCI